MVQIIKVRDNMITGVEIELVVIPEPKNTVPAHLIAQKEAYKKAQSYVAKCRTQKIKHARTHRK